MAKVQLPSIWLIIRSKEQMMLLTRDLTKSEGIMNSTDSDIIKGSIIPGSVIPIRPRDIPTSCIQFKIDSDDSINKILVIILREWI